MTFTISRQYLARYKPTVVYWHLDSDGQVLYVGCTSNLRQRDRAHRQRSKWYGQVVAIGRSEPLPWREARALERDKIAALQPPHNIVHRHHAVMTPIDGTPHPKPPVPLKPIPKPKPPPPPKEPKK